MKEFAHGLLIGKFYPPHAGHHETIRAMAARCERVSVVVMGSAAETIGVDRRAAWLRAEHAGAVRIGTVRCDAPLDVGDPLVWAAHVAAVRAALRPLADVAVDAVFCGDDYGDELARRFDAKWVRVPRAGRSATAVRRDLAGSWSALAPATRAALAVRVVVVGAESTGTTSVSRALAQRFAARGGAFADTRWVAEYGREYTVIKWRAEQTAARAQRRPEPALADVVWTLGDFDAVAAEQTRREETAAAAGSPLLVCDTDAFATAVWERRYLGAAARTRRPWSQRPADNVYLLTDHEGVPWHDDGLREGDLALRAAMTQWFADALTAAGHSWVLLTGTLEQRVDLAVRIADQALAVRARFAEPLHGPGFGATG